MTAGNVITFQLRRPDAPTLQYVELHLDAACGVEMRLRDAAGNVVAVLEYVLVNKPDNFDLDALQEAWARWRLQSESVA
jgi:hypothetical protein